MEPYNNSDRWFCVTEFYRLGLSLSRVRRSYRNTRAERTNKKAPSEKTIRRWLSNGKVGGAVFHQSPKRSNPVRTPEAIQTVSRILEDNPRLSHRRIASIAGVSCTTAYKIIKKDLKHRPYKHQVVQQLKPGDPEKRLRFAGLMLSNFADFDNIIFSDEAHFYLHGCINRQNDRTWALSNPGVIVEKPLHSARLTVWAGLASWGVVGPFYFEEEVNGSPVTVTVNASRYGAMLRGPFQSAQQDFEGWNEETWFQQDGAPPHRARIIMSYLKETFPDRLIALGSGDIVWPPRSPDLSPLDFYLWGFLKGKVYANNPKTLQDLKNNIETEIAAIPSETLKRVVANFRKRLIECEAQQGGHLPKVIFKK